MKVIATKYFRWSFRGGTYPFNEGQEIKNFNEDILKEIVSLGYAKEVKEFPMENKRAEIEDKKDFTETKKVSVTQKKPHQKARRGRPPKKEKASESNDTPSLFF